MSDLMDRLRDALADRYTIERRLGEGGMATVYLAADLKHDRQVAIKVLKPELAAVLGAERFVQEIKTTASLQHPNILPLFDSGKAVVPAGGETFLYYVMPYIEGETLRDKLDHETQLGIDEAVKITADIAEALDAAHQKGVIHRDIKPENILLHNGRPMIADFGIALAVSAAAGGRMTETGLSLGTPHYMSPEQATAEKDLTKRSDVYSLGTVLYEMLTGEPPHMGNSAQQIIMKIVTDTPRPVTELRKSVPPNVTAAVAKSLEKLAADRFDSAKTFAEALTNPAFTLPTMHAAAGSAPRRGPWNALSITTAALAVVLGAVLLWITTQPAPMIPVSRYNLKLPEGVLGVPAGLGIALSRDGTQFVYPAVVDGRATLYVLRSDELRGSPIPGTERGARPVVSPDGSQVAFIANEAPTAIKRVSLEIGQPITVVDSGVGTDGLAWGPDGFLYYDGLTGVGTTGIMRVPETGGVPEQVTTVDGALGETDHIWPEVLPNGRGVLFTIVRGEDPAVAEIAVLDLGTYEYRVLVPGQQPRFVAPQHLMYHTPDGVVWAARFDQTRLEMVGEAAAITRDVEVASIRPGVIASSLTVSSTGAMRYMTAGGGRYRMEWIDRDGGTENLGVVEDFSPIQFSSLALSPDGSRAVYTRTEEAETHLWIKPLPRGRATKFTFEGRSNVSPRWTPDGRDIVFNSDRGGSADLYSRPADGSSGATLLLDVDQPVNMGFFPGAEWLVYATEAGDINAMRLGRDSAQVGMLTTPSFEAGPQLSPDGRWLTYVQVEADGVRAFVRPFPEVMTTRYLISSGDEFVGQPKWAHSGRELFYMNSVSEVVSVDVQPGPPFVVGERRVLFQLAPGFADYVVAPDDQRFLVVQQETIDGGRELIVVENWVEELKAKLGG